MRDLYALLLWVIGVLSVVGIGAVFWAYYIEDKAFDWQMMTLFTITAYGSLALQELNELVERSSRRGRGQ